MSAAGNDQRQPEVEGLRVRVEQLEQRLADYARVEQELRDSEARWRSLVEHAPDVIMLLDREGRIQFINRTATGYDESEVVGSSGADFIQPDQREGLELAVQRVVETGQPAYYEIQDIRNESWYAARLAPVWRGERVESVVAISTDITQRKQYEQTLRKARDELEQRVAERTRELRTVNRLLREDIVKHDKLALELREGEQRFRTIAETIPVPVLISRISDGLILYANHPLCELLRVSLESLVGQKTPDFYDETADRRRLFDLLKKEGRVRNFETQLKRSDGTRRWVSISMAPISYRGQESVLGVLVDISMIKEAEDSLRSERRLLKRMLDVNERDRKLIAYEIHDGMVQDLAGAAMLLESCQDKVPEEDPDARHNFSHALRLVRSSINEARRMINGLQPPILEDAGLIPALECLVAEMTATAELTIDFSHNLKFGRIAPALEMAMYRIVQESLNNVWQHSKSPKARVKLEQTGHHVEISVRDWGVGFDPDKIKKKRYGLIGMRERARLLGGEALISSKPGEGTRITVKLPITDLLLTEGKPDDDSDSRIGVLHKP
jgi:PAS domain S-box-containing protein